MQFYSVSLMMNYQLIPDFDIQSPSGALSASCTENGFFTFYSLCDFIYQLPYGRNADKNRLETLFTDGCGTCSTKHAFLKQVADEQGQDDILFILSLFKMNARNTPKVSGVLEQYQLEYIPEAHNYLKYKGTIIDLTGPGFDPDHYGEDILSETELQVSQITDYKVQFHQDFLRGWLPLQTHLSLDEPTLWTAREQCIVALSGQ
jgi:hypothetical protein